MPRNPSLRYHQCNSICFWLVTDTYRSVSSLWLAWNHLYQVWIIQFFKSSNVMVFASFTSACLTPKYKIIAFLPITFFRTLSAFKASTASSRLFKKNQLISSVFLASLSSDAESFWQFCNFNDSFVDMPFKFAFKMTFNAKYKLIKPFMLLNFQWNSCIFRKNVSRFCVLHAIQMFSTQQSSITRS